MSSLPVGSLEQEFANTYVMVKILKIPSGDSELLELYRNIVRYNNSQNSINEKQFVANTDVFKRVQMEFEAKGFLVCIKQSDKYQFSNTYKTSTALLDRNSTFIKKFGLDDLKKVKDFLVDLEKLLQVCVAFENGPLAAVQNKSKLLKQNSSQNKEVVEFIRNPQISWNDLVSLYLLYLRAEKEKKKTDGKMPNPFYLIFCFAKYECGGDASKIASILSDEAIIDSIVKKYTMTLKSYYKKWVSANEGKEYNDMIKSPVEMSILDESKGMVDDFLAMQ